ncbi:MULTISPECIES: copper resistance protein NlpE [Hymenobacter]|uniref:copper resistance protein NlpE n=1 Tax=Hymenobacter TaxID=89966 RepID=UPI0010584D88|nr:MULTISPECIES: copper resistance protein NlpE [Hymenobacter]QIL76352.1 copper resistance protein NlpE [Hymenobacter sp. HDW8]
MRLLLLACLLLLATACERPTGSTVDSTDASLPADGMVGRAASPSTSSPSIAVATEGLGGIYQGLLPCADCAGIETVLYLYPDSTYMERRTYLDQPKEGNNDQVSSGRWAQVSANLVRLTRRSAAGPTDYRMRPRALQQLDLDGQEITGDLAERYVLAQIGNF